MHRLFTSSFAKPFLVLLLITLSLTDQVTHGASPSTPPIITVTQSNPIRQDRWLLVAADRLNLLPDQLQKNRHTSGLGDHYRDGQRQRVVHASFH